MRNMIAFVFALFGTMAGATAYADGTLTPVVSRNGIDSSGNFTAVCVSASCGRAMAMGNTGFRKAVPLPAGTYDVEVELVNPGGGRAFGENPTAMIEGVVVTDGANTLARHDFQTGVLGVLILRGYMDVSGTVVVTRPGDAAFRLEMRPGQRFVLPVGIYSGTTSMGDRTITLVITLLPGAAPGLENTQIRRFRFPLR